MWQNVNGVYNFINDFNFDYKEQKILNITLLISYIQDIYEIGMSDVSYWNGTKADFLKLREQGEALQKAEKANDFVRIFDILISSLWGAIRYVAEALLDKDATVLRTYFWDINKEALKENYPMILEDIKAIKIEKEQQYYRPYGIRGRVVYKVEKNAECDLYSGYNPIGLGMQRAEIINLRKYRKIYIWGDNAGFEIDGIVQPTEGKIDIEVYITDLMEFKSVLLNTPRRGVLLHPNIKFKFNMDLKALIESFDLQRANESYIYVWDNNSEDLNILRQFISNNSINSNIGAI